MIFATLRIVRHRESHGTRQGRQASRGGNFSRVRDGRLQSERHCRGVLCQMIVFLARGMRPLDGCRLLVASAAYCTEGLGRRQGSRQNLPFGMAKSSDALMLRRRGGAPPPPATVAALLTPCPCLPAQPRCPLGGGGYKTHPLPWATPTGPPTRRVRPVACPPVACKPIPTHSPSAPPPSPPPPPRRDEFANRAQNATCSKRPTTQGCNLQPLATSGRGSGHPQRSPPGLTYAQAHPRTPSSMGTWFNLGLCGFLPGRIGRILA